MAPSLLVSLPLPLLLITCAMLHPSSASGGDLLMLDRFHRWMSAHGRSYPSTDEKLRRLEVYRRNVELIEATNRESERLGYELGENQFTDLTNEEFVARYTGAVVPEDIIITTLAGDVNEGHASTVDLNASSWAPAPQNFDWRDQGAVTPAKFQGTCGACWAFVSAASVESLNKIKGGELVDLSVQELLDCANVFGQTGCIRGDVSQALQWVKRNQGIVTEAEYPYQEKQGSCKSQAHAGAERFGKITDFKWVFGESTLQPLVLQNPVVVQIDGSGPTLQNYRTGIYKGPCTTNINHVVLLIGYGVNSAGEQYWILKNSWSEAWGQKGFFFMRRGADGERGLCGVGGKGDKAAYFFQGHLVKIFLAQPLLPNRPGRRRFTVPRYRQSITFVPLVHNDKAQCSPVSHLILTGTRLWVYIEQHCIHLFM